MRTHLEGPGRRYGTVTLRLILQKEGANMGIEFIRLRIDPLAGLYGRGCEPETATKAGCFLTGCTTEVLVSMEILSLLC